MGENRGKKGKGKRERGRKGRKKGEGQGAGGKRSPQLKFLATPLADTSYYATWCMYIHVHVHRFSTSIHILNPASFSRSRSWSTVGVESR